MVGLDAYQLDRAAVKALFDRLVHHAQVIVLKGQSYRQKRDLAQIILDTYRHGP